MLFGGRHLQQAQATSVIPEVERWGREPESFLDAGEAEEDIQSFYSPAGSVQQNISIEPPNRASHIFYGGREYRVKSATRLIVTAYSSTVDQTDSTPFITASGTSVRWGVVAANFLPIGTKIRIPEIFGDEVFFVEDRMNERYNRRVDIWMHTRQDAKDFGVRNVIIEVLSPVRRSI